MNRKLLECMRAAYQYPPARLVVSPRPTKLSLAGRNYAVDDPFAAGWPNNEATLSSWELDDYHHGLLNSDTPHERFLGVVSCVYWGNIASSNGTPTGFAQARAQWMLNGKTYQNGKTKPSGTPEFVSTRVEAAKSVLALHPASLPDAVREIMKIPFLGLSFASKVLAFMDPLRCAVLDSVVLEALRKSADPKLNSIRATPAGFAKWCLICRDTAATLKAAGSKWIDWDGTPYEWRAVDVERAVFAFVTCTPDPADVLY